MNFKHLRIMWNRLVVRAGEMHAEDCRIIYYEGSKQIYAGPHMSEIYVCSGTGQGLHT